MSSSQRLTLRQADAQDRQQRRTQQRQELTLRIRKEKKSQYLARKRQYAATPPPSSTLTSTSTLSAINIVQNLIKDFCSIPTLDALRSLNDALQATSLDGTEDNWLVVLPPDDHMSASSLIGHLLAPASTPEGMPLALNILVRLTSIAFVPVSGSFSSFYYGNTPLSWSSLVSNNGAWLSYLVQLAPQSETACVVLGNLVGEASSQTFIKLRQAGLIPALISAVHNPAAAWALTNAIRHDTAEYARVYCNDQALSPALLEQLLKEKAIATQAAWMLATLTNREEEVVQYLLSHPTFATTMVECMKRPVDIDQLAPLVQAMGNIATCSTTEGGPPFSATLLTSLPTLTPMLGQLLQIPTNREVVQQAAWLAGCFLLDAGMPNHPATTIAAPVLVPLLFQELRDNTPHSLGNQRELCTALWNALVLPGASRDNAVINDCNFELIQLPPWDKVRSSLSTLVKLVASVDMDSSLAAISVLQLLLQRNAPHQGQLREALEEQEIRHVLEQLCDRPNSEIAEVAAKLLDDYFYVEDDAIENDDGCHNAVASSGTFTFGQVNNHTDREIQRGLGRGRGATLPAWMSENVMQ